MIEVPEGVNVQVEGNKVTAKGPAGEVQKTFGKDVALRMEGKQIDVSGDDAAIVRTVESVLSSMLSGAKDGYKKSMKLLYAHFPISIEVKGKEVLVKNFLGEKQPRKTAVIGNTKIEAKGQNVTVSGPDKEAVGQTIANLRAAMRIRDRDARVFQDGIYEVEGG